MHAILTLAFVYVAESALSVRICSDCTAYISCAAAKKQVFNNHGPLTQKMFADSLCGFEYIHYDRIPKVCCSDFNKTADVEDRSGFNERENMKDNPKLNLLPDSCGDINGKRIIGGRVADLYEFPWMALISYRRRDGLHFLCSGSIINSRYILTAAHCAVKPSIEGVRVGEYDIDNINDCQGIVTQICETHIEDLPIENITIHSEWNTNSPKNDIALLRLGKDIDFNHSNVLPICLPITKELRNKNIVNLEAVVAGWGITETGNNSPTLLKTTLTVETEAKCRSVYDRDPKPGENKIENQICAGAPNKDTCQGDSGGPLHIQSKYRDIERVIQYGIISYGTIKCGIDIPGVYTDVTKFIDWILENIRK